MRTIDTHINDPTWSQPLLAWPRTMQVSIENLERLHVDVASAPDDHHHRQKEHV